MSWLTCRGAFSTASRLRQKISRSFHGLKEEHDLLVGHAGVPAIDAAAVEINTDKERQEEDGKEEGGG